MSKNYAVREKQERIAKIQEILKQAKDKDIEVAEKKLIAEFCINYGITAARVAEYVGHLVDSERIERYKNEEHIDCIRLK